MPTPPMTDDDGREALRLVAEHGGYAYAARAMGIHVNTLKSRCELARKRGLHLSAGALGVVSKAGLAPVEAQGGWLHSYDDEGKKIGATYWKPPAPEEQGFTDHIETIRAAFEAVAPCEPVSPPPSVAEDLCTFLPYFDVHWGMHAWGRETGGPDYDLRSAALDIRQATEAVLQMVPASAQAIILIGGDFFHADDNRNETPANRHKLDVDGRHFKVIETAIVTLCSVIRRVRERHAHTRIRVLRGNHDEHSHMVLTFALAGHFRTDPAVTVEMDPRDLFMAQWGKSAIFAHHGDKAPPERQALYLSDTCPFWSETRHRHYYTGHIHKDLARDVGPLRWESLRAFAPSDSYAAGMGYASRRALRADVFHKVKGRVLTAHDPIEREA
jgi:hypothetical protein